MPGEIGSTRVQYRSHNSPRKDLQSLMPPMWVSPPAAKVLKTTSFLKEAMVSTKTCEDSLHPQPEGRSIRDPPPSRSNHRDLPQSKAASGLSNAKRAVLRSPDSSAFCKMPNASKITLRVRFELTRCDAPLVCLSCPIAGTSRPAP